MRFTPAFAVSALIAVTLSGTTVGAPLMAQAISATSITLQLEGERLREAGDYAAAIGFFETALTADPRNADAYVGLGRIATTQDLPGKAIGLFREALALQPTNRAALAAQGEAMLARGAIDRARSNLARLRTLCGTAGCPELAMLDQSINAAGERTVLRRAEVMPLPVAGSDATPPSTN
jgi:tetratricopeptide (TPR) repeat protein